MAEGIPIRPSHFSTLGKNYRSDDGIFLRPARAPLPPAAMQTESPATAETPTDPPHGAPPAQGATTSPNETGGKPPVIRTAEDVEAIEDIAQLQSLMDQSGDVGFEKTTRPKWQTGFKELPPEEQEDDTQTQPAPAPTEATPGQDATPAETQSAEPAESAPPATLPKKDANRVRIGRFAEDDRMVISRMAEKDGLTIDAARAELIAEGKLKASPAEKVADTESSERSAPVADADIESKTAEIAGLETRIAEAAEAYDTKLLAQLQIEHNRALAALAKLESRAELRAEAEKEQRDVALHAAVAQSEADAVAMFPAAGQEGSDLYEAIADLMAAAPSSAFLDPDYPITFAAKAARQIGYRPAQHEPKAAPLVPRRPARQVPQPASGSSAHAAARKPADTNYEQEMADAEASGDVRRLAELMDKASGRRAAA